MSRRTQYSRRVRPLMLALLLIICSVSTGPAAAASATLTIEDCLALITPADAVKRPRSQQEMLEEILVAVRTQNTLAESALRKNLEDSIEKYKRRAQHLLALTEGEAQKLWHAEVGPDFKLVSIDEPRLARFYKPQLVQIKERQGRVSKPASPAKSLKSGPAPGSRGTVKNTRKRRK